MVPTGPAAPAATSSLTSPGPSLLKAGSGGSGGGSDSREARVYHGSKGLAARRGDRSHREPFARALRRPSLRPGAQPPSPPFAPQSSLALPLPPPAAVTATDPPSCNPTLSAFLFLFQQVRTGCPSRGYGGRRVHGTSEHASGEADLDDLARSAPPR